MRIFFIGNVAFSKAILEQLIDHPDAEIVGIATKSKSTFNSDHVSLDLIAEKNSIPFKYVMDINAKHILAWISSLKPDVVYCFGWSSLIKKELLDLPPLGVIGFHPAELPKNRGRHPLIWALVLGLKHTASTFFRMDEGADSGDIINQQIIPIEEHEYASDLYTKAIKIAQLQVRDFTTSLANGAQTFEVQDHSKSNHWRKRGQKDGEIDFRMSSKLIYNLIRGLSKPYVGAHVNIQGTHYKVWSSEISSDQYPDYEPGKILKINELGWIKVVTGSGSIWLQKHEIQKDELNEYFI